MQRVLMTVRLLTVGLSVLLIRLLIGLLLTYAFLLRACVLSGRVPASLSIVLNKALSRLASVSTRVDRWHDPRR